MESQFGLEMKHWDHKKTTKFQRANDTLLNNNNRRPWWCTEKSEMAPSKSANLERKMTPRGKMFSDERVDQWEENTIGARGRSRISVDRVRVAGADSRKAADKWAALANTFARECRPYFFPLLPSPTLLIEPLNTHPFSIVRRSPRRSHDRPRLPHRVCLQFAARCSLRYNVPQWKWFEKLFW